MGIFSRGPKRYPQIGQTHKNGDRMFGVDMPYANDLMAAGTPKVSSLHEATVTELIRGVKVHDELRVSFDGKHWWASAPAGLVGRLTWPPSMRGRPDPSSGVPMFTFDTGTLHVRNVTIDRADKVVDLGGFVVPD
ncbi:hypothetical protein C5B94_03920 [Clavibacter michiganensis]|uniref:hypothetical protein n=1 Tax=Clavibacter michiganensis TaxID=28447 RepID=UPI000CE7A915|nr:hypothetical protein [Clavibacter michiganensis]PPF56077.1 hypothetical protein C5B94_03920 [Clavibacter michiganensis]